MPGSKVRRGSKAGGVAAGLALGALLLVLAGCVPGGSPGARLYRSDCASCHGADGGGGIRYQADAGANLLDDSWVFGGDEVSIERVLEQHLVAEHPPRRYSEQEVGQLIDHILYELRGETP